MNAQPMPARVVVVGGCASGKSTLVAELRRRGLDAVVCAQEHSDVPTLWTRSHPDLLVFLFADLQTVRERRGLHWSKVVYEAQQRRLRTARGSAHVTFDTALTPVDQAVERIERMLADRAG
jgi:dienelactone hydrolase